MPEEREVALKILLDKFLDNGWIEPSQSDWCAQAFLVPKPGDKNNPGEKKWRLVVDYRYLNTCTKDNPFPLPLIENLVQRQLVNRMWSVFDLQDGFHQMHLEPKSREYTAFQTPCGSLHWTVLPMGVNNGPAMFQRMIAWILRGVPKALAYIDDVITGSSLLDDSIVPTSFLENTGLSMPYRKSLDPILLHHLYDCCQTLIAFRRGKVCTRGSKVKLFRLKIQYCGQILERGQRKAAPSKFSAVHNWEC